MWTSKIFWKLFLVYAALSLTFAVGLLGLTANWQRTAAVEQTGQQLFQIAGGIVNSAKGSEEDDFLLSLNREVEAAARHYDLPVVLVDTQGRYLAGSGSADENYLEHAEILAALQGSSASNERADSSGAVLHVATPIRQSEQIVGVVRLSQNLAAIDERMVQVERAVWLLITVATLIAVVLSYAIIGRIIRPLAELTEGAQAIAAEDEPLGAFASTDELGVLGNAFDQMQRKLARRVMQLKENTERLATVLGSMAEGVLAVSTEENILLANEASRVLLDMTVAEPVGRPLLAVTRNLAVHNAFLEAIDSTSPIQKEFESQGPTRRVISLRATRLPGEPSPGVMLVLHDVSELRRLENLRREFVANVSHELKTPLSSIMAYAETLKNGAINDPEYNLSFVTRIEEQAERLHQLILDLIHIARVESGQEAFEVVDVDLAEAVYDTFDQYKAAALTKQISLVAAEPAAPVIARADEEGIRTILSNLVDNAIKYTPAGGTVTVRWQTEHDMALLEVQDTGIGIAEMEQSRVFERFYRVDKARSRELGGTGLGLSIVKHLAQAFGGNVGLESRPQQGCNFRIRLLAGASETK